MKIRSAAFGLVCTIISAAWAQAPAPGTVTGSVFDPASGQPVEFATVIVQSKADGKSVRAGATDAKGSFELEAIPAGDYQLVYGLVGGAREASVVFSLDARRPTLDLGRLALNGDAATKMGKVEVTARREAFYNSIDRKVYHVGKDLQSVAGSASDLLQNVPSVQVDIEGNIALRGDANVLILINGKTSAMLSRHRAAVLEQMPADGIEKIEVITNPSAKYKPDGTAGIINLTLKQKPDLGHAGSVRVSVGNARRSHANVTVSFNPKKYTLFVTAGVRQDDRRRTGQDDRSHTDGATQAVVATSQRTVEESRPLSRLAQFGADYQLADRTKLGGSVHYNFRDFVRHSSVSNLSRNAAGAITADYDRLRTAPEFERDLEFTGTLQRSFPEEDREFNIEVRHGWTTEQADNRYTNVHRAPARPIAFDFTLIRTIETNTETSADYAHPFGENSKLETGYNGQLDETDLDFRGSFSDATGATHPDPTRTNRFLYEAAIHAFYGTFARKFGAFGLLAALRFEHAAIDTNQVTARLPGSNRYRYHGMTDVTRYLDSTTLLTTRENLGTSRSGGLELGANTRLRDRVSLNFSANAYRNEIDATNLGFSARRSLFAWDAKLNATCDVTKTTLVQLNTNYTARRLTPQGYRYPTHVANLGLRHNFADKKTAVILTVSDVFNSLRERTHIDTPVLRQDITRRRSSRIAYLGIIYNFGRQTKKPKKDELTFDNSL